jgi:hypothetical protein
MKRVNSRLDFTGACRFSDLPLSTAVERIPLKTRELMDEFAKEHGTFIWRKLLHGCELTTEEGQKHFKENGFLKKICAPCVQSVVEVLESIKSIT